MTGHSEKIRTLQKQYQEEMVRQNNKNSVERSYHKADEISIQIDILKEEQAEEKANEYKYFCEQEKTIQEVLKCLADGECVKTKVNIDALTIQILDLIESTNEKLVTKIPHFKTCTNESIARHIVSKIQEKYVFGCDICDRKNT